MDFFASNVWTFFGPRFLLFDSVVGSRECASSVGLDGNRLAIAKYCELVNCYPG